MVCLIFIHHGRRVCRCRCVNHGRTEVIIPWDIIDQLARQFGKHWYARRAYPTSTYCPDRCVCGWFHRGRAARIASLLCGLLSLFADFRRASIPRFTDSNRPFPAEQVTGPLRIHCSEAAKIGTPRCRGFGSNRYPDQRKSAPCGFIFPSFTERISHRIRAFGFTLFLHDNLFCRLPD